MNLTEEQQEKILSLWNSRSNDPPALLELIKIAFPDKNVDGRSKEGRAVKEFLASRKIKARPAHEYKAKTKIELTDDQKKFIEDHAYSMVAVEIAKVLFKNEELTNLHQETRTVADHIESLSITTAMSPAQNDNQAPLEYKPPTTFNLSLSRINKYVPGGFNKQVLSAKDKKCVESLLKYLSTYRFTHQISTYGSQTDRDLFESSYIRYTFDKFNLAQEEVDQYLVLSAEVVIASNIQRRVEHLQNLLDDVAEDTEGRRISMALVESISTAQTEYNQCINRQTKLLGDLKEKRSDKLKKEIKENASILNLVQLWKEEDTRQKMVELAKLRRQSVKEEVSNLQGMDEMKSKILGLSEDEI